MFALKTWRHCLYDVHCGIYTDHETLKYLFTQKQINVRQGRWLEVLTDYEFTIHYHPRKENKVADALNQKSIGTLAMLQGLPKELLKEIVDFELVIVCGVLGSLQMCLVILDEIRKPQSNDKFLTEIRERMKNKPQTEFASNHEGTLEFKGRACVPDGPNFKEQLLEEAHQTP